MNKAIEREVDHIIEAVNEKDEVVAASAALRLVGGLLSDIHRIADALTLIANCKAGAMDANVVAGEDKLG